MSVSYKVKRHQNITVTYHVKLKAKLSKKNVFKSTVTSHPFRFGHRFISGVQTIELGHYIGEMSPEDVSFLLFLDHHPHPGVLVIKEFLRFVDRLWRLARHKSWVHILVLLPYLSAPQMKTNCSKLTNKLLTKLKSV